MLGHTRGVQHDAAFVHPLYPGTVPDTLRGMPDAACCLLGCNADAAICRQLHYQAIIDPGSSSPTHPSNSSLLGQNAHKGSDLTASEHVIHTKHLYVKIRSLE